MPTPSTWLCRSAKLTAAFFMRTHCPRGRGVVQVGSALPGLTSQQAPALGQELQRLDIKPGQPKKNGPMWDHSFLADIGINRNQSDCYIRAADLRPKLGAPSTHFEWTFLQTNMPEWASNAAVEHETIRAVVDAINENGVIAEEVVGLSAPDTAPYQKLKPGSVLLPSEGNRFFCVGLMAAG